VRFVVRRRWLGGGVFFAWDDDEPATVADSPCAARFLGYALYRISELSNGPIIYRDMLHGEFTLA
jgi:hypothetical protein